MLTFRQMLREIRDGHELSQKDMAKRIGITPQYLCDLEQGRRLGSVEVVEKICTAFGRGPKGRREWHVAGARSHGWDV